MDHSCDPNTLFDVENLSLDAIRDISSGELITFFYPGSEVELAQEFRCKCGADSCLGQIRGGFYLTGDEMKRALEQGHCTGFMKRHLERLLES